MYFGACGAACDSCRYGNVIRTRTICGTQEISSGGSLKRNCETKLNEKKRCPYLPICGETRTYQLSLCYVSSLTSLPGPSLYLFCASFHNGHCVDLLLYAQGIIIIVIFQRYVADRNPIGKKRRRERNTIGKGCTAGKSFLSPTLFKFFWNRLIWFVLRRLNLTF